MAKKFLPQLVGPAKRVVRQDGRFICGICQEIHDQWPQALSCLRECWSMFMSLPPVVMRRQTVRWMYRCRYCARDYLSHRDAKACSDACSQRSQQEFDFEWSLLGYIPELKKNVRPKPMMMVHSLPAKIKGQTKRPPKEITDPDESGPISTEPASEALSSEIPPVSADEKSDTVVQKATSKDTPEKETSGSKKEKDHGFYREGARYVCEVCNTKYFTKDEVMKCFNSHQ